jgi:hypothetical protein
MTLAYFDSTFSGLIPCKLLGFERATNWPDAGALLARVEYTADRPGYPKGSQEVWSARYVIPRDKVRRRILGRHLVLVYDWKDYGIDIPE